MKIALFVRGLRLKIREFVICSKPENLEEAINSSRLKINLEKVLNFDASALNLLSKVQDAEKRGHQCFKKGNAKFARGFQLSHRKIT